MMADKSTIKLPKAEPWKKRGHREHKSGAGIHKDKRTKRNRTRSDKNRNAIRESKGE